MAAESGVPAHVTAMVDRQVTVFADALPSYKLLAECGGWWCSSNGLCSSTGERKACFSNVHTAVQTNKDAIAVYGFATMNKLACPLMHAWCVDTNNGKVLESTAGWGSATWYYGLRIPTAWVARLASLQSPAEYDALHAFQWLSPSAKACFLKEVRESNVGCHRHVILDILGWPRDRTLELVPTIESYGAIRNGVFVPCQSVPNFDKADDDLFCEPFTCKNMSGATAQYTLRDMDCIYAVQRDPLGPDMVPPRQYCALGREMHLDGACNIGYALKNTVMDSVVCSNDNVPLDEQRHRIQAIYLRAKHACI